jgi:hypothetical protein
MEGSARYSPEYADIDMTIDPNGAYSPASVPRGSNASRFTVDLNNELSESPDLRHTPGSNSRHMTNGTGPPPPRSLFSGDNRNAHHVFSSTSGG